MRILQSADGSRAPFDFVTITLHWLTATLIVLQAATGLAFEFAKLGALMQPLLDFHRSAGTLVWCVALARIVWRSTYAEFPPFPDWMSDAQRWIATKTELLLYGLLFLLPLTGLAATLTLGKPFHLLFLTVPPLLHRNVDLFESLLAIHRAGALVLFAAIAAHAAIALIHHYLFRNEVLERMAPWMRRNHAPVAVVVSPIAGATAPSNDNRRAA